MLGPAQAPQTHALPDLGACTVMVAHFVDDPLDLVDHWSGLLLPQYLGQCSYCPKD